MTDAPERRDPPQGPAADPDAAADRSTADLAERADEFRAAAAALAEHMRALPKQALEHLPAPRRVSPPRQRPGRGFSPRPASFRIRFASRSCSPSSPA